MRCPYAAELFHRPRADDASALPPERILVYCRRRNVLGSSGWHLHDAPVPPTLRHHPSVRIRWRSTSAPDYHEDHPRGPAWHVTDDED